MKDFFVEMWVYGLGLLLIVGIACALERGVCVAKAKAMGFECSWGPFQGCMIETKPGKWVPLENYRVME